MTLPLSEKDYHAILLSYKQTKDKRLAIYLNIILLKHKGYRQFEIADILNIDENTVCSWLKKFEISNTITEYSSLCYCSYVGKLSYKSLGQVDDFIENGTFLDTKPIISYIKAQFNVTYSVSGITKLLQRLGFSYKEKIALPSKLNIEKQEDFIKQYENIQSNLTHKCALFFMDAVHPQHNTHTLKAWLRKGKPVTL